MMSGRQRTADSFGIWDSSLCLTAAFCALRFFLSGGGGGGGVIENHNFEEKYFNFSLKFGKPL